MIDNTIPTVGSIVMMRTTGRPARARVLGFERGCIALQFDDAVAFHHPNRCARLLYLQAFRAAHLANVEETKKRGRKER